MSSVNHQWRHEDEGSGRGLNVILVGIIEAFDLMSAAFHMRSPHSCLRDSLTKVFLAVLLHSDLHLSLGGFTVGLAICQLEKEKKRGGTC